MPQIHDLLLALKRKSFDLAKKTSGPTQARIWFALSMLYAAVCAALALRQAFAAKYVLAADVRQHVFWMFRFLDPKLFPNDPIADYFQSIAPPGFAALYRLLAGVGIDPLLASKLIPAVLGLLAAGYLFGTALRILRTPAAAALATILLCQTLWLSSDLCSATPHAFFYPLFTAFLYYHVSGRRLAVLITILLQNLFFPPGALVSLGVVALDLVRFRKTRPRLSREPLDYLLCAGALALTLLTLFPYLHTAERFGPLVSYAEAWLMPEFAPGGRVPFFYPDFWNYWVHGSGGLHIQSRPSWLFAGFLWPILAAFPRAFPLLKGMSAGVRPLLQVAGSSLVVFAISHAVLFHLYLPSRYTQHPGRILLALAAGGVIVAIADSLLRWCKAQEARVRSANAALVLTTGLLLWIVLFPMFLSQFPRVNYITGAAPDLYEFFAAQSATTRIASLADEANNLPVFCHRSIIFGVETAVPFHRGYYPALHQRGVAIARAQYSSDLALIQRCLRDQHIDFWLLDQGAFTPDYVKENRALRQLREVVPNISSGTTPLFQQPPRQCVVFANRRFVVLDARALLSLPKGLSP